MALDSHCFDGVADEWPCRGNPAEDHSCDEVSVVHVLDQEFDSGRTWPMCFRHAFRYALAFDEEARELTTKEATT